MQRSAFAPVRVLLFTVLLASFTGCSFFHRANSKLTAPGAFSAADRERLSLASKNARFTVIALTPPGSSTELARRVKSEHGSIRIADEKTGIVVAELDSEGALKLERANQSLGSPTLATYLALDQVHDYAAAFEPETVHPESGQKIDVREIKIDRSVTNSQMPTHEMGVLDFEKMLAERFGLKPNGDSTTIAIIDTGLDLAHTDVFQDRVKQSWDMTKDGQVALLPARYDADKKVVVGPSRSGDLIELAIPKSLLSPDGRYFVGTLREVNYGNVDLDQDGSSNGEWPVLLSETANGLRVAVDANHNQTFTDDSPIRTFEGSGDTFVLDRARVGLVRMNVNIPLEESGALHLEENGTVLLNFAGLDSGQHGTHVAGIAAGRFDGPQFGGAFRGGAPNAKLFGFRVLGQSGGADADIVTAIVLAVKKGADIINMSLGSSQRPSDNQGTLALAVDQVARRTDVLFVISAGNAGAGMNSVGTPSTASRALSIGAYASGATWRTAYNAAHAPLGHFLWSFSSVGPLDNGEVRPSLLAPGAAYSSIPLWRMKGVNNGYDLFQGTSMAAPAATGAIALLLDGVRKLKGRLDLPSDPLSLSLALIDGAIDLNDLNREFAAKAEVNNADLPTYKRFEQGAGLLNLPNAFSALERRAKGVATDYAIETESLRESYSKPARGIYTTSRLPSTVAFTVRKLPSEVLDSTEHNFYREVKITSDVPWVKPTSEVVSLNGLNASEIDLQIDQDVVAAFAPGVHSARIVGRCASNCGTEGSGAGGENQLEFIFDITYVKAREVSPLQNGSEFLNAKIRLKPAAIQREFFYVGNDRSRFSTSISVPEFTPDGKPTRGLYKMTVYDPAGGIAFNSSWVHGQNPRAEFAKTNPAHGIWEVLVQRSFSAEGEEPAVFRFSTDSLVPSPQAWTAVAPSVTGAPSGATQSLTQNFRISNYGRPVSPVASLSANRIQTVNEAVEVINKQKATIELTVPAGIRRVIINTVDVVGAPNADIDLRLFADGRVIGESGGPVAQEHIEATVTPGARLTLEINGFDLGSASQGTVDVTWELVLPFDLRGQVSGLTGTLPWSKSMNFTASFDIAPIPAELIRELKKTFTSTKLLGEISLFDGRALPEKQIASIPIEITF